MQTIADQVDELTDKNNQADKQINRPDNGVKAMNLALFFLFKCKASFFEKEEVETSSHFLEAEAKEIPKERTLPSAVQERL